jgi:catechol 2,3-dioxygenase-like lactoylglutathione lyase family enzyme
MISHLSVGVSDLPVSTAFYDAVLTALGYDRVYTGPQSVGYGMPDGREPFALKLRPRSDLRIDRGFHLAFVAESREAVVAFHAEAIAHGGMDDGKPGLRPHYGSNYYAAFVIDPDGHRLEAVCKSGN